MFRVNLTKNSTTSELATIIIKNSDIHLADVTDGSGKEAKKRDLEKKRQAGDVRK